MIWTNKFSLPEAFRRAVLNDVYDNQGSDFTPSSLDTPPKAYALAKAYPDKVERDISSCVDALIGQGSHVLAERAARPGIDLCEERFFMSREIDGKKYKISAAIDLYETDSNILYDWKTTKKYAFSKKAANGKKPSWVAQMNIGAELLRLNGHQPKQLFIIGLLKDWSRYDAGTDSCPPSPVVQIPIPMWSQGKVYEYIDKRVRALTSATPDTPCSEHWGGRRCEQWCDSSSACEQYQKTKTTGLMYEKPF